MVQGAQAEVGLIGGTGLYDMKGIGNIRDVELETPFGAPSSPVRLGRVEQREVAFIARHGPGHRLLPTEIPYRANIYALKMLGVSRILAASAVGSLREDLPPRSLVVPDQFIDRTRHRVDTFFGDGIVAHVSMANPFSEPLRKALLRGAKAAGHEARDGGTQLCMEGPQFSTRAESLWYRGEGCDVIGMTSITEARLAREAEIGYASLNLVTDYDAWRPEEAGVDAAEILAVLHDNADVATRILRMAIPRTPRGHLPENHVLTSALITPLAQVPEATRERLAAILAPHLRG
jgi:5'-methylthioadenosine phosphorylase